MTPSMTNANCYHLTDAHSTHHVVWAETEAHARATCTPHDSRCEDVALYPEGPAEPHAGNALSPDDLGITREEYAAAVLDSLESGDTGIVRVKGRRVYAA